ncbi:electron transfer flavoprotein subunit beta/FixA family protein [Tepidanaerobacter syntrophicus]|uniref:electron transfer flavoprotein subunit beta/FixA family protein n=1 Tax=Tepidanaerobacter syntrophicus TaxID=224999 RepID=UPI001BD2933B
MKIAVCIKQVPAYSSEMVSNETGTVIRSGIKSMLNPYDLPAIETAVRIKGKIGANIDIFTMGPREAEAVIREAYSRGADRGFLVNDKRFSGADVLATSYTISQAMKTVDSYDLIICGRQSTDGCTAQVGGELAELLDIPSVNWVNKICDIDDCSITVEQLLEKEKLVLKIPYPCLISVEPSIYSPRMPSLKLKILASKKDIKILSLKDMKDKDFKHYGLRGSATKVEKIFPAPKIERQDIIEKDPTEVAKDIFKLISLVKDL